MTQAGRTVLEWLLIAAGIAAMAAATGVAVQRIVDSYTEEDADPAVRVLEAEVAAAEIEAAETAAPGGVDAAPRCMDLEREFADVVASAVWSGGECDLTLRPPSNGS